MNKRHCKEINILVSFSDFYIASFNLKKEDNGRENVFVKMYVTKICLT